MHNVQCTGQNIKGDWLDFKKKFFWNIPLLFLIIKHTKFEVK